MNVRTAASALLTGLLLVAGAPTVATAQAGTNPGVLNPNLAAEDELGAVPGLNQAAVTAIVEGRPHLSMLALHDLLTPHLGEGDRDELYSRLFLPINLNDTSEEEILLVPGVGDRMAHEFEEYRPYVHLAEFRREIGKYVDDEEVARLEQFVFVPVDLNDASDEES